MNFNILIQLFIVCVSILSAQSIKNRLFVPLYVYPSVSFGYDSNYLKLSSSEMDNAGLNLSILGDSQTFDSDISRIKIRFGSEAFKSSSTFSEKGIPTFPARTP